jgi:manganese/zinc/iron transport system substrate-binding protein
VRRLGAALAAAAALLGAAGCASTQDATAPAAVGDRPIRVTTTVNFLTDTVERIGGDRVEVTGLMGPGVDPHLYKASAGDVEALREADLVLYGGLELEGKMGDILGAMGDRAVAVTRDLRPGRLLRKPGGDAVDPHVWFDPELWLRAAETVADTLAAMDPGHADAYRQRLELFRRSVEHVAEEAGIVIGSIPERRRVLVTSHDAFGYFGRAFGLDVVAIQGLSTAAEATTADIRRVAEIITRRGVPAVFVESSVPRQTVEAVVAAARERGHEVRIGGELYSDAAGAPGTPEGTYTGMLQHNVREIAEGLSGSTGAGTPE